MSRYDRNIASTMVAPTLSCGAVIQPPPSQANRSHIRKTRTVDSEARRHRLGNDILQALLDLTEDEIAMVTGRAPAWPQPCPLNNVSWSGRRSWYRRAEHALPTARLLEPAQRAKFKPTRSTPSTFISGSRRGFDGPCARSVALLAASGCRRMTFLANVSSTTPTTCAALSGTGRQRRYRPRSPAFDKWRTLRAITAGWTRPLRRARAIMQGSESVCSCTVRSAHISARRQRRGVLTCAVARTRAGIPDGRCCHGDVVSAISWAGATGPGDLARLRSGLYS